MKKFLIGITILLICMVAFSDPIPIPHPAGSDSQIQYNNGGLFGGDSTFTFNDSTKQVSMTSLLMGGNITLNGNYLSGDGGNEGIYVGASGNIGINGIPDVSYLFDIIGNGGVANDIVFRGFSTTSYESPGFNFIRSHSASKGTKTTTLSGDRLGQLAFYGINTNSIIGYGAGIVATQNGTAGVSRVPANLAFRVSDGTSSIYDVFTIANSKRVGINETSPAFVLEMTDEAPRFAMHNDTHEDADGGRESRIEFRGEQSGGEETTLARIEAGHDGSADDQKGYIDFYTNDGSDNDTPTKALRIDSTQTVTGKLRSSDGVSGTLVMDDGTTEKITLVFTGGILTSRTVEATTSSALMDWTD